MLSYLKSRVVHPSLLVAALGAWVACLVSTAAHYLGAYPGNDITWLGWLVAIALFCATFADLRPGISRPSLRLLSRPEVVIALLVLLLYLPTHLWNFPTAPWNINGLFDDAAWDIYFAKNHAFNGAFQAGFFDEHGLVTREVVFHYYVITFFKLLGYNVLVFVASMVLLGYVTVLFTTLVVHELFHQPVVTAIAALLINFFPLQYVYVFVGHHYFIAGPLMAVSLYFLYAGFRKRSFFQIALSAVFAALCLDSAIMGKQYLVGLAAGLVAIVLLDRPRWRSLELRALAVVWVVGFVIASTPLAEYVLFNPDAYFGREGDFLERFLASYATDGFAGPWSYIDGVVQLFIAKDLFAREFLHDFLIIPLAWYLLLIPGLVIAVLKRRFEIALLAVIPIASTIIAGPFDFRVVLAVPIWVIAMAYTVDFVLNSALVQRYRRGSIALASATLVALSLGLGPAALYLWQISMDPHHQYLMPHRDVAVSRLVQDIVADVPNPTSDMKRDEFSRDVDWSRRSYDALVCPAGAYGIMHLYLQDFDDKAILAFCGGGTERLVGRDALLATNLQALLAYQPAGRGLKLIWEETDLSHDAIEAFVPYERFGSGHTFGGTVDGQQFSVYVLTIPGSNLDAFLERVAQDLAGTAS